MATVRELVTKWGFEIDDKPLKKLDKGIADTKSSLKALGAIAIGTGAALFGMAKMTADAGNEIQVTSDKVGLSTDSLQEYRFAAEQAGVSAQQMDATFFNLNKTLGEARQGFGSGRDGIELLARETGSLIDLNGTVDQQFQQITDSLNLVTDEAKRAAIAEKFFGSQGREIATLLNKGSGAINKYREEFKALGGTMGSDLIKSSQDFIKAQSKIFTILKGIRNEVGAELLPAMVEVVDQFKEWFIQNRALIRQNIKKTIGLLVDAFKATIKILKTAFNLVQKLANMFGGLEKVVKILVGTFIALKALQLTSGFGNMVIAVFKLAKGMKFLGAQALIAQAKLMLMPLAVTAIIAALALLAEDFVAFSEGRDSIIGRIIAGFDEFFENMNSKFSGLGTFIKGILTIILTPIRAVVNAFRSISTVIDVIRGKMSFMKGLSNIGSRIANTLGFGDDTGAAGMFGLDMEKKSDDIQDATSISPGSGVLAASGAKTTNNSTNNVNGKFEISVLGLPPEQAQKAAQDGFADIFGSTLREAQRDTTPQIER